MRLALVASLLLASNAASAQPPTTDRLLITLDVPSDEAPGYLCVIGRDRACDPEAIDENDHIKDDQRCRTQDVSTLDLEKTATSTYRLAAPLPPDGPRRELRQALAWLTEQASSERCDQPHERCRPEIRFSPTFQRSPILGTVSRFLPWADGSRPAGAMTCGGTGGATGENRRVAFISLELSNGNDVSPYGVDEVKLVGTTASLTFLKQIPATTKTFVQVMGGDYAPSGSSSIGSDEHVIVKLQPRCSHYIAKLPGHRDPISRVELTAPSFRRPLVCTPKDANATSLDIEVPFTSTAEEKTLVVTYGTTEGVTGSNEARWVTSLPPVPLLLAVRHIQFRWQRPIGCLADTWSEATPAKERSWNASCPRVTVSDETVCDLLTPEEPSRGWIARREIPHCEYRCTFIEPQALPLPLRFDRIRSSVGAAGRNEAIYSWNDQLKYEGHELTSTVAPADRRVMLELADPNEWRDRRGDQVDSIRVVNDQGFDQLDLTRRDDPLVQRWSSQVKGLGASKTEHAPPKWTAMSTPGRTCSDRLRIAIFGTRFYDEQTFEVRNGRVVLGSPFTYRPRNLIYVLGGIGSEYRSLFRSAVPYADLGFGVQVDLKGPWSLNIEGNAQLTQVLYKGIEALENNPAGFERLSYLRAEFRIGPEWWVNRRRGVALLGGLAVGTPLDFANRNKVGSVSFSIPLELHIIVTLLPHKLWLVPGLGLRLGERHFDFETDFRGAPTPSVERDASGYIILRIRGRLG